MLRGINAGGGIRTRTGLEVPSDFKSDASTGSATPAHVISSQETSAHFNGCSLRGAISAEIRLDDRTRELAREVEAFESSETTFRPGVALENGSERSSLRLDIARKSTRDTIGCHPEAATWTPSSHALPVASLSPDPQREASSRAFDLGASIAQLDETLDRTIVVDFSMVVSPSIVDRPEGVSIIGGGRVGSMSRWGIEGTGLESLESTTCDHEVPQQGTGANPSRVRFGALPTMWVSPASSRREWQHLASGVSPEIEGETFSRSEPQRGESTLIRTRMG